MNVMELFGKSLSFLDINDPDLMIPDEATETQVINSIKFNKNSTNNYLKMLAGKAGIVVILAGLYLAWEHNKRAKESHANEERRKEELHQARMKSFENKEV